MMLAMELARPAIDVQRERAERLLNGVRAAVLIALTCAAIAYVPHIPLSVQRANWAAKSSLKRYGSGKPSMAGASSSR